MAASVPQPQFCTSIRLDYPNSSTYRWGPTQLCSSSSNLQPSGRGIYIKFARWGHLFYPSTCLRTPRFPERDGSWLRLGSNGVCRNPAGTCPYLSWYTLVGVNRYINVAHPSCTHEVLYWCCRLKCPTSNHQASRGAHHRADQRREGLQRPARFARSLVGTESFEQKRWYINMEVVRAFPTTSHWIWYLSAHERNGDSTGTWVWHWRIAMGIWSDPIGPLLRFTYCHGCGILLHI